MSQSPDIAFSYFLALLKIYNEVKQYHAFTVTPADPSNPHRLARQYIANHVTTLTQVLYTDRALTDEQRLTASLLCNYVQQDIWRDDVQALVQQDNGQTAKTGRVNRFSYRLVSSQVLG